MPKKKRQETNQLNGAVQSGIETIIENHPRFANFQEFLVKHIDQRKIQEKYFELYEEALKKGLDKEKGEDYIYNGITNYVASGDVIDEKGKEIILKNSLEEKSKNIFQRIFQRRKINGEKYLDNAMEAFHDLYTLFKSGEYAQRMPELTESVTTLYDLNFLDPAVDVLKAYGWIDNKKHKFLKENIYNRAGEESQKVVGGIEKYIVPKKTIEREIIPQKRVASIIGLFGIILIAANLKITGAVIGDTSKITIGIAGGLLLLLSLLIFLKKPKKKL
ncbi:MAG: hypothetical protein ABIE36_00605 [Candidatus Diapherotrites archaeon]